MGRALDPVGLGIGGQIGPNLEVRKRRPLPTIQQVDDGESGLRETLQVMYRPQLARLETEWGLDLTSWTSVD